MARMISRQDAAELLGCNVQTVTNWVERGLLKGHVVGRALMVDRDSIEQYFDDLKELGAMAQQISDLKSEYRHVIRNNKEVLEEAKGVSITPARARDAFKANQLALIGLCKGYLRDREGEIFSALIRGEKLDDVGRRFGLAKERIVQIAIKTAEKLSSIKELEEIHEQNKTLKAENEQLRQLISKRDMQLNEFEKINKLTLTLFEKHLEDFNLSTRTLNVLYSKNCETIADLVKLDREDLMSARNFGRKSFSEVDELLSSLGLQWGMNLDLLTTKELKKWSE